MVGSLLRRMGLSRPSRISSDYEALLPEQLPTYREDDEQSSYGSLMALHSAHSRAKRAWLILDANGKISQRRVRSLECFIFARDTVPIQASVIQRQLTSARGGQVDKHELCLRLSLPVRDLRILDPAVMTSQSPSSIFIRDNAIIFNIESLRMLIQKDEVLIATTLVLIVGIHQQVAHLQACQGVISWNGVTGHPAELPSGWTAVDGIHMSVAGRYICARAVRHAGPCRSCHRTPQLEGRDIPTLRAQSC